MSKPPEWAEIRQRFGRMVLALGFRKAARKMKCVGKSTLYNWFNGAARRPGAAPIRPSEEKVRAMLRVLVAWEREHDRVRTLKPAPVWSPRWTKPSDGRAATRALAYR